METLFTSLMKKRGGGGASSSSGAAAAIPEENYEKWWTAFDEPAAATAAATVPPCKCGAGPEDIVYEDMAICKRCGEIGGRLFDTTAEYRFFAHDDKAGDPCRVGAPQDHRLPEASLGTMILGGQGKNMYRIRRFHTWNAMPYKERSLLQIADFVGEEKRRTLKAWPRRKREEKKYGL